MLTSVLDVESYEMGDSPILQPWEENPHRLIGWLEMLRFSARNFFWCGRILEELRTDCLVGSMEVPGDEPIFQTLLSALDDRAPGTRIART